MMRSVAPMTMWVGERARQLRDKLFEGENRLLKKKIQRGRKGKVYESMGLGGRCVNQKGFRVIN